MPECQRVTHESYSNSKYWSRDFVGIIQSYQEQMRCPCPQKVHSAALCVNMKKTGRTPHVWKQKIFGPTKEWWKPFRANRVSSEISMLRTEAELRMWPSNDNIQGSSIFVIDSSMLAPFDGTKPHLKSTARVWLAWIWVIFWRKSEDAEISGQ